MSQETVDQFADFMKVKVMWSIENESLLHYTADGDILDTIPIDKLCGLKFRRSHLGPDDVCIRLKVLKGGCFNIYKHTINTKDWDYLVSLSYPMYDWNKLGVDLKKSAEKEKMKIEEEKRNNKKIKINTSE
jgi:hypothetical protein